MVAASALACLLAVMFWLLSSGVSLRITFVPGLVLSWGVVVWMYRERCPMPSPSRVLPLYMVTLAWQGVHFAEEYQTGFWAAFPTLYAGAPYPLTLFVWVNMISYAVFNVATVVGLVRGLRPAILPSMFFVIYGAIGNAISHVTWSIISGCYFPGLFTAIMYFVLGPLLLHRIWPLATPHRIAIVVLGCAAVLVPLEVILARSAS